MSSEATKKNPYSRGKGKLIAQRMLEGKTNEEIFRYIKDNKLDEHYKYPVKMDDMYEVRSRLRKGGLLMEGKLQAVTVDANIRLPGLEGALEEDKEEPLEDLGKNKGSNTVPPIVSRRPDWDMLSAEQINSIPDLVLKANILNYKTDVAKQKQEFKPEFATRGEIDLLRTEIVGKFGGIEEKINQLLKKKEDPEPEEPEEEDEEEEEDEAPIYPSVVPKENPLSEQEAAKKTPSKAGENLVEVEKGVIISKLIGFTTKSLMWYELDKTDGLLPNGEAFPGNLADYVNSCIEDVHVSRNIGLSITQRRSVK